MSESSGTVPRPPEGPDREALAKTLRAAYHDYPSVEGRSSESWLRATDAVLALLPTPPAPGDREGLRAAAGAVRELFGQGCLNPPPMGITLDSRTCGTCANCSRDWTPEAAAILRAAIAARDTGLRAEVERLTGENDAARRMLQDERAAVADLEARCATLAREAKHWMDVAGTQSGELAAALAARDTDQGAGDALRALSEAATPGPWETDAEDNGVWHQEADGQAALIARRASEADAAFIAAAANYVRAALARATPEAEEGR